MAALPPERMMESLADVIDGDATVDRVRRAQGLLAAYGFYRGRVDGIWGPRTSRAAREFERLRAEQIAEYERDRIEAVKSAREARALEVSEKAVYMRSGNGGDVRIRAGSAGETGGSVVLQAGDTSNDISIGQAVAGKPATKAKPAAATAVGVDKTKPRRRFRFMEEDDGAD